ncbi:MAG: hypothetical protein V7K47_18715 [Nostoc sp.]
MCILEVYALSDRITSAIKYKKIIKYSLTVLSVLTFLDLLSKFQDTYIEKLIKKIMALSQQTVQEFFKSLDSDRDGELSSDELMGNIGLSPLIIGLTNGKIHEHFNQDRTITFEQLKQLIQEAGNLE